MLIEVTRTHLLIKPIKQKVCTKDCISMSSVSMILRMTNELFEIIQRFVYIAIYLFQNNFKIVLIFSYKSILQAHFDK